MDNFQRHVAYKVSIDEINTGRYHKEEGLKSNFLIIQNGIKASRVNIFCVMISELTEGPGFFELMIDDGTGSIQLRSFESGDVFQGLAVGSIVCVIGRPREFNNEMYLIPEIIKKIDKNWVEVRRLELSKRQRVVSTDLKDDAARTESVDAKEETAEIKKEEKNGTIEEEISDTRSNATDHISKTQDISAKVYAVIKELDTGSGADHELVIQNVGEGSDKIVSKLLIEGEIFETSPGKLKILN